MKPISALAIAMCLLPAAHAADVPADAAELAASAPVAACAPLKSRYVVKAEEADFCLYGGKPTGDVK